MKTKRESGKQALVAILETCAGLRSQRDGNSRQSASLVGAAASIMVRRRFSACEKRAITAYVLSLFGGNGISSFSKCRIAEVLIRSELGELELLKELPSATLTFDIASAILEDLVRTSRFDSPRIEALVNQADMDSKAFQKLARRERLVPQGLLRRAIRRRAGRPLEGRDGG